ncbi:MAG: BatD family protein [Planctomycetales bacterium]|nr:BatD family protein [Planctomycetales bacterium]
MTYDTPLQWPETDGRVKPVDPSPCFQQMPIRRHASGLRCGPLTVTMLPLVYCVALFWSSPAHAAPRPELIVETDATEIYEGESVLYRVTLNHVDNPSPPSLDGFDEFQIGVLAEQTLDSQQITIINGTRHETVRRGRQYNYRLTPRRSGELTIPSPSAKVANEVLRGKEVRMLVVAAEVQDVVVMQHAVDRTTVYPTQPFTLTLSIFVKGLPAEFRQRDPLTIQPKPPVLSLPWLDDDQIPTGIQAEKTWREILESLVSRRGAGFQLNNIGGASAFSLFEQETIRFHPQPTKVTRKDRGGQDVEYWEYQFRRTLIPQKQGTFEFGPVTLKGTFATAIETGTLKGEKIYAVEKKIEVTVKDVPLQGRPDSFCGAIGTFGLRSELSPTSSRVGDPMTLTLLLTGRGTVAEAKPPDIAAVAGIPGAFRTYEATEEIRAETHIFTYGLRPLAPGITEFPSISMSYFNVDRDQYVTVSTDPIPVSIREAESLLNEQIVSSSTAESKSSEALQVSQAGLLANDNRLSALHNDSVLIVPWLMLWVGMLATYATFAAAIAWTRYRHGDPAVVRRRGAGRQARITLREVASLNPSSESRAICDALRRAIVGLIADYLNVPPAGLTPRDVDDNLERLGVDPTRRLAIHQFLQACDAARYGLAAEDFERLEHQCISLVNDLDLILKKQQRGKSGRIISAGLLCGLAVVAGCTAAVDANRLHQFQAAEQEFAKSLTQDEFVRVASQYQQILDSGLKSGAVLFNQGNAWIRAGEVGRGIAAYRQAKRFRPRDPSLDANLRNAIKNVGGPEESRSPQNGFAGYIFFWQDWCSYSEKLLVTTTLLAAILCAALSMQLFSAGTISKRWRTAGTVIFFVFSFSTFRDWMQIERSVHGIVISAPIVARKGDSENYETAFNRPLPEGTEFVVLEQRNDWLHVQLAGSGVGWIPSRNAQIW